MSSNLRILSFFAHPTVKKLLVFLVVVPVCAAAAYVVLQLTPAETAAVKASESVSRGMPVSVERFDSRVYPAMITVLGEVTPLWQTTVKAQIGGEIVFLADHLQEGIVFMKGDLLVQLAKSNYEMQVAEARSRLASAEVALLNEEGEAVSAQRTWEKLGMGDTPDSPLVLREPQLTAAHENVNAAKATLVHAETLLGYTDIRMPFDGVILKRRVSPGETLFAGDEVASLYGMETVEVGVHLDVSEWALLPKSIETTQVKLRDPEQKAAWDARVVRASRHLSRQSRLRTIFLEVKEPLKQNPPLLPGTFVQAVLTGRDVSNLLRIPEASLTKRGTVWFVDEADRLEPVQADPVFYGDGVVFIRNPLPSCDVRIVVAPNSSFTDGLRIQPIYSRQGE